MTAVVRTVVSPYRVRTEPLACRANSPTSNFIVRPPISISNSSGIYGCTSSFRQQPATGTSAIVLISHILPTTDPAYQNKERSPAPVPALFPDAKLAHYV